MPIVSTSDAQFSSNVGVLDLMDSRVSFFGAGAPLPDMINALDHINEVDKEAFMAQGITIDVQPAASEIEPSHIRIGLNGRMLWVPRGQRVRLPRAFVEILFRSITATVRTKTNPDSSADEGMFITTSYNTRFPFSIIHDPAGEAGRVWIGRLMRENELGRH